MMEVIVSYYNVAHFPVQIIIGLISIKKEPCNHYYAINNVIIEVIVIYYIMEMNVLFPCDNLKGTLSTFVFENYITG